jgi:hypothetical protein
MLPDGDRSRESGLKVICVEYDQVDFDSMEGCQRSRPSATTPRLLTSGTDASPGSVATSARLTRNSNRSGPRQPRRSLRAEQGLEDLGNP